jgi:predicted HD phosphohydrolase
MVHAAVNALAQHAHMDRHVIFDLYTAEGWGRPGAEGLNRVQHAWQCARLARHAGAAPSLQLAAWLHELEQVLADPAPWLASQGAVTTAAGLGGAGLLERLFGPSVAQPVALLRNARRCLASTKADFRRNLPTTAWAEVERDGGLQTPAEARSFLQLPYAPRAIRLCLWDLEAQDPGLQPPSLQGALDSLRRLMWLLESAEPLRSAKWSGTTRPGRWPMTAASVG